MMIRLSYTLSVLLLVASGAVTVRCVFRWLQNDGRPAQLLLPGGAVTRFMEGGGESMAEPERVSPLLVSAQTFALYLNPPAPPVPMSAPPAAREAPRPEVPATRLPTATPKFKVRGTSCCLGHPERSVALIREAGATEAGRWVKEGAQVGHFTIHEIRAGSVVYLDGDQLREMAIDRETVYTSVAADNSRPATTGPPTAANSTHRSHPSGRPRRPTGGGSFTVGSARTSALD